MMEKVNLMGLTASELKDFMKGAGEAPFRGKQLFKWIYSGIKNFDDMTDFSLKLREKLKKTAYIGQLMYLRCNTTKRTGQENFCSVLKTAMLLKEYL